MIHFSNLFHFTSSQVDSTFARVQLKKKILGLKLLQAIHDSNSSDSDSPEHGKLLIVVPRSYGKAHDRNKIRRQLRALFYEEKLYTHLADSILICYPQAKNFSFEELKAFLKSAILPEKTNE